MGIGNQNQVPREKKRNYQDCIFPLLHFCLLFIVVLVLILRMVDNSNHKKYLEKRFVTSFFLLNSFFSVENIHHNNIFMNILILKIARLMHNKSLAPFTLIVTTYLTLLYHPFSFLNHLCNK